MSDILTTLWLNVDSLSYMDKERVQISQDDVELLKNARKNLIVKPGVCLLLTLGFSKYRSKLWSATKKYFLGERMNRKVLRNEEIMLNNPTLNSAQTGIHHPQEIKIEYKNDYSSYEDYNRISVNQSRKLSSKRRKEESIKEEIVNLPRSEPTVSESHLAFTQKYIGNVRRFALFKKYTNKFTKRDSVYNRGESFLLNSKLIYIPFLLLLFFSFYDLSLTYAGLYIKYQPLIDEYYQRTNQLSNKH